MNHDQIKYEEIERYPYPNLMAELKESGYSISTLSLWMWGRRGLEEQVWARLQGIGAILATEAFSLSRLFDVGVEYLFDSKLALYDDVPIAVIRWKQKKNFTMQLVLRKGEKVWISRCLMRNTGSYPLGMKSLKGWA